MLKSGVGKVMKRHKRVISDMGKVKRMGMEICMWMRMV